MVLEPVRLRRDRKNEDEPNPPFGRLPTDSDPVILRFPSKMITFHPAGESACDVEFFITYEFKNRALAMLMGAMFDAAFRRFAAAFEQRADVVYGRKTA